MGNLAELFKVSAEASVEFHGGGCQDAGVFIYPVGDGLRIDPIIGIHRNQADIHAALAQRQPGECVIPMLIGRQDHIIAGFPGIASRDSADTYPRAGDQGIFIGGAAKEVRQHSFYSMADRWLFMRCFAGKDEIICQALTDPVVEGGFGSIVEVNHMVGNRKFSAQSSNVHLGLLVRY